MATAENAKLQYEAGQNSVAMTALTDSGDATTYTSAATLWSGRAGYSPVVRPNGLLTGGVATATATNNQVACAALTLNLQGVVASVSAGNTTITRPATAVAKINSLTVSSGGALTMVAGTDSATTAFSETRGAAGGPPFIPVDSVEIAQIRVVSNTAAPIAASEIYQVVGLHQERADFPLYDINFGTGKVTFIAANPLHHTGSLGKKVYASYATPIFADVALASDFVPPETSWSVSSTQVYGTTLGSTASTLNQGTFTAYLANGVTDSLVGLKNALLWFKFFPDRYASPYALCQGKLGIARTFPADNSIQAACTISAASAASEFSS